ncbi:MAG: electron transfer flavoprotein subunit alpha/FixB family protein [Deltaproteobacteria bacterium]|nr:electron transfer flavoprotein subunit alpha/FixB family protein [Deltaproteobacteria bacterium]
MLTTDLSSWKGIWVVAECRSGVLAPVTLELLAKSRELAGELGTEVTSVLMGYEIESRAQELIFHGADRVLVVDHPELATFTDEVYGNILADLAKKERPEIILAGATAMGRSYIPRVATILKTGLTADCTGLDIRAEDRVLLQTRPAFGGNLLATIVCPRHRPQMATVRPHVMKANAPDPGRKGEVIRILPGEDLLSHRVRVLESVKEQAEGPNLSEADVIVTAGRGFEQEKNVNLARELADLLGGTVGATRAAVDAGWLSGRTQIGQTGVTVSPKLYMACGVSGAIQHLVGMQGSEIIVAINKDAEAPIFDVTTYGLVGDVKEILPLLIRRIQKERGL